ncbi:hypothetical protein ACH42_14380 [Endozoicomonas sp. (ex Bugula neritina AB1)]|nr:hypothetical protein ACH42_14380 [Endozoicomonas sp. (ex Bugula neritina AB1)]
MFLSNLNSVSRFFLIVGFFILSVISGSAFSGLVLILGSNAGRMHLEANVSYDRVTWGFNRHTEISLLDPTAVTLDSQNRAHLLYRIIETSTQGSGSSTRMEEYIYPIIAIAYNQDPPTHISNGNGYGYLPGATAQAPNLNEIQSIWNLISTRREIIPSLFDVMQQASQAAP